MKLFGSLTELISLIFRKNSQTITVRPNNAITYTAARIIDLPAQDAASTLVSRDSTDTLTNKSISGSTNTLTNLPLGSVTGILATASGGTGQNSTATFPTSGVLVTETATQTLTNKTLTSPVINTPTGITKADVGLGNVDNTSDATKNAAVATLTNKTITAPVIATIVNTGTLTLPTSTDTLVGRATTDTLTNKSLTGAVVTDYEDLTEIASPSTPASGKVRIYAKTDKKLYKKDSTGLESSIGGSGAGEKNYIANTSDAGGLWTASGAGITLATSTTAAELPEESIGSAIKLTGVSGTDYARYRFTLDDADKNKKNKIQFALKSDAAYVSNDFKVEMYSNTASNYGGTYVSLPISASSSIPKSDAGSVVQFTFDTSTLDYYELRVTRVTGTSFIAMSSVIVGPGVVVQGAVVEEEQVYTPVLTGFGTVSTNSIFSRRVGSKLEIRGTFTSGTPTGVEARLALPPGLTVLTNGTHSIHYAGTGTWNTNSSSIWTVLGESGSTYLVFGTASTITNGYAKMLGNAGFTNTIFSFTAIVPINEWTGSGVSNLGQNSVEYAFNTSLADSDDLTSFGSGAQGQPATYTFTSDRFRRIRFQSPIQPGDRLVIEFSEDRVKWSSLPFLTAASSVFFPYSGSNIGVALQGLTAGSTDVDMYWGRYKSGTAAWGSVTGYWRVKKEAAGAAVSFGKATTTSAGLVTNPSSRVWVTTGNGFGSSGTRIRRFSSVVENVGTAITYLDDATNGGLFTINETGLYSFRYTDTSSTSGDQGVTKNAAGNVDIASIAANLRLSYVDRGNQWMQVSNVVYLVAGDVIKAHTNGFAGTPASNDRVAFDILQVAKF